MSDQAVDARLLKRRPTQARSIARVQAILDATAALLGDGDIDALTMRAVAAAAQVPTATVYQFFESKHTLIQAVAARYVHATPDVLDRVLADDTATPREVVTRVVDAYAAMLAAHPAMRALWLGGAMDDLTRRDAEQADDAIAERLRRHLAGPAGADPADWRFLVTLISNLLRLSFATSPAGDPGLLERTRRVAGLYVDDLLERSA